MNIRRLFQGTIHRSLLLRGYIRGYRTTCSGRFFILKTLLKYEALSGAKDILLFYVFMRKEMKIV